MTLRHRIMVAAVLIGVSSVYASGQKSAPRLRIDRFMTTEEMQATGIAQLTPAQREALDEWLTSYTLRVIRASLTSKLGGASTGNGPAVYGAVGSGHWISSNDSDGAIITLEDGSMWQINSVDQPDTSLWLPITDITVAHAASPIGAYNYDLIDTEDHEEALAKYIGTR